MPYRPIAAPIASRFSAPRRCSVPNSSPNRSRPLAAPWVRLASQKPPLRPLAAQPILLPSMSTTDRPGLASLASSAAHRPPKPPPTTARSQATSPRSDSRTAGASRLSSQNDAGLAAMTRRVSSWRRASSAAIGGSDPGEGVLENGEPLVEQVLADHQRRQEADHVAERPAGQRDQPGLVAGLGDGRRGGRVGVERPRLGQLDGQHGAAAADVGDDRV